MPSPQHQKIACVLLAAGAATRFGGGKLTTMLDGMYLGVHAARTLASIEFGHFVAVCNPADKDLCAAYTKLGFEIVANDQPENGQSQSLRLGIETLAAHQTIGIMVALADMPFVTVLHLNSLLTEFKKSDQLQPVASFNGSVLMPPAIFPFKAYADIIALSGDQGARHYLNDAVQVIGNKNMLADIDRPEDLRLRP